MQDQDKEVQYAEIVKLFGFVLSQYRLYSDRHPAAQLAIRNFSVRLEMVLNSEPNVTMAFVGGRLIINDHALDHKKVGVAELLRETHRLHVESLTFDRGANGEEIGSFFKLIALPARDIEALGGLKKVLEEANLGHVRIGSARIQIIKEEEAVVKKSEIGGNGKGEGGTTAGQGRKIERIEDLVDHLIKGAGEKIELSLDVERLAYEVEMKPELIAKKVIHQTQD